MTSKIVVPLTIVILLVIAFTFLKRSNPPKPPRHIISGLPAKYGEIAIKKGSSYLIRNVSVIPMNKDTVLMNSDVLIIDGRIRQIENVPGNIDTTSHPVIINGFGKYLIPGLNDMHVHVNDDNNLLLFIANGVTTVRNMAGFDFHLELRRKIEKGEILGPTFYTAGPILEGIDPVWDFSIPLSDKKGTRDAVKKCKSEGYDFIKVYHTLSAEVYREILRVSDSIDIPVVGHIPFNLKLNETLALTQYSLEHIDVRPISNEIPLSEVEQMIGESKKWMCPTLVVHRNIERSPHELSMKTHYENYVDKDTRKFWNFRFREGEDAFELQKRIAWRIFSHGGKFIAGTDCLNSYVLAGFSIHEELEEMVNAGLSEFEALKSSTVNAAEFLKKADNAGTIESGKIADLILLDGNPLEDIVNTKKINGVFVKGKWFNSKELARMLNDVRAASEPN